MIRGFCKDFSNLLKTSSPIESANRIFWKPNHKLIPQNESFEYRTANRIREMNLLKTDESNQNESMDSRNESMGSRFCGTIPASLKNSVKYPKNTFVNFFFFWSLSHKISVKYPNNNNEIIIIIYYFTLHFFSFYLCSPIDNSKNSLKHAENDFIFIFLLLSHNNKTSVKYPKSIFV
jgi:hypothetical protein